MAPRGVLTLVDHAVPARLREAYLRLRARDPATEVIVDVRQLAELPPGATAILALEPPLGDNTLDWLNLHRPVLSERRLNVVLWCEGDAAAALAWRAPDFFDWISARVDCPPAPAAHAVAEVKRAICSRASGIAWDGPGLEETLAAVRPGRPIRRVTVGSYQSMIDALTAHEPGWLVLEGIDTEFHLRRLRWAMAETGRRVIVFRRAIEPIAPGWWTVHARHESVVDSVHSLTPVGGAGRLAVLAGLDPDACEYGRLALARGIAAARLEELLVITSDPRAALQDLARQSGWGPESQAERHMLDDDPIVFALRGQSLEFEQWAEFGKAALNAGDFEVAIRWLTAALRRLSNNARLLLMAELLMLRGQAYGHMGDIASARVDLEQAHSIAQGTGDASMIAVSAAVLGKVLVELGEPLRAHAYLELAWSASSKLDDTAEAALVLDAFARVLLVTRGDFLGAHKLFDRALSIKRKVFATENHPSIEESFGELGRLMMVQGNLEGWRDYLERSLKNSEQLGELESPSVVRRLRDLAELDWMSNDTRSARAHLERALALERVILGSDEHPDIAETLVELARVNAATGDLDGAQGMLERALAIQSKVFGETGKLAGAMTRRELSGVLIAKGDLTGAIGHLEYALATLRRNFQRDDHPDITAILHELDRLQKLQGELQRP